MLVYVEIKLSKFKFKFRLKRVKPKYYNAR